MTNLKSTPSEANIFLGERGIIFEFPKPKDVKLGTIIKSKEEHDNYVALTCLAIAKGHYNKDEEYIWNTLRNAE